MITTYGEHTYFMDGEFEEIRERGYAFGKYCSIAEGVKFFDVWNHACIKDPKIVITYPYDRLRLKGTNSSYLKEGLTVGNDVWIGRDAIIYSGIEIGDGAIIGAHSVVRENVPPYAVVVGNPAKVVRYRFDQKTINKLREIKWWEWPHETVMERLSDLLNIDEFIGKYGET